MARAFEQERRGPFIAATNAQGAATSRSPGQPLGTARAGARARVVAAGSGTRRRQRHFRPLPRPAWQATRWRCVAEGRPDSVASVAARWAKAEPGSETPYREWDLHHARATRSGRAATIGRTDLTGDPAALAGELALLAAAENDWARSRMGPRHGRSPDTDSPRAMRWPARQPASRPTSSGSSRGTRMARALGAGNGATPVGHVPRSLWQTFRRGTRRSWTRCVNFSTPRGLPKGRRGAGCAADAQRHGASRLRSRRRGRTRTAATPNLRAACSRNWPPTAPRPRTWRHATATLVWVRPVGREGRRSPAAASTSCGRRSVRRARPAHARCGRRLDPAGTARSGAGGAGLGQRRRRRIGRQRSHQAPGRPRSARLAHRRAHSPEASGRGHPWSCCTSSPADRD